MPKIKTKCDFCGKIIIRSRYRIQKTKRHFCNKKCHYNYKRKRAKIKCEYCGKVFERRISGIKRSKKHFCNVKCWKNFKIKNRYKVNCDYCGKIILKCQSRFKSSHRFCNEKCRRKFERRKIKCAYCGEITERVLNRLKNRKNYFCNRKCHNKWKSIHYKRENSPNWRGGIGKEPYPFDFNEELKGLIHRRDNYTCQYPTCKQKQNGKLHCVHHVDYNKNNLYPMNLITLCCKHNIKVNYNRNYWTKYFQNLIRRKYELENREV